MAKYEFRQSVRIAPTTPKKKPVVFAAGTVHDITDEDILNHPHFAYFEKGGAIVAYTPPVQPAAKPSTVKKVKPVQATLFGEGGALKDAQAPKVEENKKKVAQRAADAEKAKDESSKATDADPETEIGGDEAEPAPKPSKKSKSK